jgi:DNA-3-methyladenine glycosylase II
MRRVNGIASAPVLDVHKPADLASADNVVVALREAGPVARLRNPHLWDALATSVVRQVIRAGQARKLYQSFCREHGEHITTSAGTAHLFPTPEAVLALPDGEFTRLGMAFKRLPLRAAAEAYLDSGANWADLDPVDLLVDLQRVPRIGPWTAGATVADVFNDYALYPFADLAVRTWAKRLASGRTWPETEPEFARVWQRLAGEQLSEWTLLTLAWGVRHAMVTGAATI